MPEVYTRPHAPRLPLVCMGEVGKQVLRGTRERLPMRPGKPERADYEYERGGVANLSLRCEPLAGKRRADATERRTRADWAEQIRGLVMDNLNTHSPASPYAAFAPQEARRPADEPEIHRAPEHGGWPDMAEIELSALSRQCLGRRVPALETLQAEVEAWERRRNGGGCKLDWGFTAEDARIRPKRLYPSIQE